MDHPVIAILSSEFSPLPSGDNITVIWPKFSVSRLKTQNFLKVPFLLHGVSHVPVGAPELTFRKDVQCDLVGCEMPPSNFPCGLPYLQSETYMVGEQICFLLRGVLRTSVLADHREALGFNLLYNRNGTDLEAAVQGPVAAGRSRQVFVGK